MWPFGHLRKIVVADRQYSWDTSKGLLCLVTELRILLNETKWRENAKLVGEREWTVCGSALNLSRGRRGLMLPYSPTYLWTIHATFSAYFIIGIYLNYCLYPLSPNVKEYICAWLEAQEETLNSSFFVFISQNSKGKVWENEGRKKLCYFPLFPQLPLLLMHTCLSAQAHPHLPWSIIRY